MQTIKTALCSFGMSGWVFHAPFIQAHPGFTLHGVWERTKQLSKEKYPEVIIYRSLEELLGDEEVELVIVNTPNYTHYEYTKKALLANKNVVVEKPFTTTSEEAAELIELAKQKGKLITVFHNRRFDSDFKTVQKIVMEGVLGEIVEVEIHFDRFKEELSAKVHKEVPGEATGSLYDLGSHLIDQALQLFGKPISIFADVRIVRPISKVDDYFEVVLYYTNLRVKLKSSYLVREALPAFILHGSLGSFIKSRADIQETSLQAGKTPGTPDWGKEPDSEQGLLHTVIKGKVVRERIPTLQGSYLDYFEGVFNALRNQTPGPVPVEDALEVVKIIELSHKSSKERRVFDYE
ncbi:MAG: Gfo/Idh/MocA family oxidoreductase [Chitinophagaceae bacterium]